MEIEDVARGLYGLAPEEFTRARNAGAATAKAEGDKQLAAAIQALRKPTTGAWLLNQLVRQNSGGIRQVLDLGARLRAAQGTLSAADLRTLDRQRRELTGEMAHQAAALGRESGGRVSAQVITTVEETLRSAMIDAAGGAALATGLLTDTFTLTGLEPLDPSAVLALPDEFQGPAISKAVPTVRRPEAAPDSVSQHVAETRRDLAVAEAAEQGSRSTLDEAQERLSQTRDLRVRLESERDDAEACLKQLTAELAATTAAEEAARRARDRADRAVAEAASSAGSLRRRLAELLGDAKGT